MAFPAFGAMGQALGTTAKRLDFENFAFSPHDECALVFGMLPTAL